ncbi:hypothetical protein L6164_005899 [Bauhinia variegata]|uniref:Uncharacterized protein n=1 Tax=Bauhinia variegata TaxID=167791 RepID=A0ACB9PVE2_BAUVA|nr:hypothetical protein L6164_005899 [Bauhinia variegata]
MDLKNQNPRSHQRFSKRYSRNHKGEKPSNSWSEISDAIEDESSNDSEGSVEIDPCILNNELSIFVGTWNVAGRSPVGSLAVDLDDWLNLKNTAADIYVLGFQEIVPLKALNVIGTEDQAVATNWNLLIGKSLNHQYGFPWLTPMLNSISGDNYNYMETAPSSERRMSCSSHTGTPVKAAWDKTQNDNVKEDIKYTLVASKKMVGVFISVWIKKELLRKYCISDVKVSSVACGIMGYLGNKGSVAVSMLIEGNSFCFVAAHLASGEKKGDEGRRNYQAMEIFRRTCFPRTPKDDNYPHPLTILGHDRIFWFGDLNYRLYLEDHFARQLIRKQDWKALQEYDQLRKEQEGGVFEGWKEGSIEFPPTYKYSNSNRYIGSFPSKSGEKPRTPAWCDRILWYGKGVKQLHYFRSESKFSDHRPVSALFSTQIEIRSSRTGLVEWNNIHPMPSEPVVPGNHVEEIRRS